MRPDGRRSRIPPEVFRYSGLGCAFAAGVLGFSGLGFLIDRWLGSFPAATVVGALVGMVLASLSIWRQVFPPGATTTHPRGPRDE